MLKTCIKVWVIPLPILGNYENTRSLNYLTALPMSMQLAMDGSKI